MVVVVAFGLGLVLIAGPPRHRLPLADLLPPLLDALLDVVQLPLRQAQRSSLRLVLPAVRAEEALQLRRAVAVVAPFRVSSPGAFLLLGAVGSRAQRLLGLRAVLRLPGGMAARGHLLHRLCRVLLDVQSFVGSSAFLHQRYGRGFFSLCHPL